MTSIENILVSFPTTAFNSAPDPFPFIKTLGGIHLGKTTPGLTGNISSWSIGLSLILLQALNIEFFPPNSVMFETAASTDPNPLSNWLADSPPVRTSTLANISRIGVPL